VGVTVGVGEPYARLSALAAACFAEHTGLATRVLGAEEFADSGASHPAALRLSLFDYVDAPQVVYFDADWLCLREWAIPCDHEAPEVFACRDFVLRNEWPRQEYDFAAAEFGEAPLCPPAWDGRDIRDDYVREIREFADLRRPCWQWINTGLLVLNRRHHRRLLEKARHLYAGRVGHHNRYYEQPALVKALEELDISVTLMPRAFNVLAVHEKRWPSTVVGLHIKPSRHAGLLALVAAGAMSSPAQVREFFVGTSRDGT
jgi:hypothetical protein